MSKEQDALPVQLDELLKLPDLDPNEVQSVRRAFRTTYLDNVKRQVTIGAVLSK